MANIIIRRDRFGIDREFRDLRHAMDRLFDDSFFRRPSPARPRVAALPVDVLEQDGKLIVKASLPGFDKDDIDVRVDDGVLSIKAEHSEERDGSDERVYRRERRYGAVARRLALPSVADGADVEAELKDGVLTVSIPVPEANVPKQIEIKTAT